MNPTWKCFLIYQEWRCKAFQLKLTPNEVKEQWEDVKKAIGKSIQFLRSNLKVRNYAYLPYRDMLALIAYYYYDCHKNKVELDKKFLEEWFWKVAFSNRYSGSSFNKIGEDRAYIFDRKLRNEEFSIDYDINISVDKLMFYPAFSLQLNKFAQVSRNPETGVNVQSYKN